jgi:serine protease AprX
VRRRFLMILHRRLLAPAAIVITLLLVVVAVVVARSDGPAAPVLTTEAMDADRDRIFDDLGEELAELEDDARVQVRVVLTAPLDQALPVLERELGAFTITHRLPAINGFSAELSKQQITTLATSSLTSQIEANPVITVGLPTESRLEEVYGAVPFTSTTATDADPTLAAARTALGLDGSGQVVAVLDTGIDARHTALTGKVDAFASFVATEGSCSTPPTDRSVDVHGHGTHVAGIITGSSIGVSGVAPAAHLVSLRVFNCTGSGFMSYVDAALQYILDNPELGVTVANLSLGASPTDGTDSTSRLVNQLTAAGVVVVVAAGNSGPTASTVGSPGGAAYALTTGAIASPSVGGVFPAMFSSRGPLSNGRIKPDIAAPGVSISSASANTSNFAAGVSVTSYRVLSGTSMAAPFVAGLAALALQADPDLAPSGTTCVPSGSCPDGVVAASMSTPLADLLASTARDAGASGKDNTYGFGIADAGALLTAATGQSATLPAQPVQTRLSGLTNATRSGWSFDHPAAGPIAVAAEVTPFLTPHGIMARLYRADGTEVGLYAGTWHSSDSAYLYSSYEVAPATRTFTTGASVPAGRYTIEFIAEWQAATFHLDIFGGADPIALDQRLSVTAPTERLTEGASTTATIALVTTPTSPVTVTLTDPTQAVSFSPSSLILTDTTPVNVTVTALADVRAEGLYAGTIQARTSSTDPRFDQLVAIPVPVEILDAAGTADLELITRTAAGLPVLTGSHHSGAIPDVSTPQISADGRYVTFTTRHRLAAGDTNWIYDVYRYDHQTRTTTALTTSGGYLHDATSDGRYLVLAALANYAGAADTNATWDLYRIDTVTNTKTLITVSPSGQAQTPSTAFFYYELAQARISEDGDRVAFISANALLPTDTSTAPDVYVRTISTATTALATVDSNGTPGTSVNYSGGPIPFVAISPDGSTVAYTSLLNGLVPGETGMDHDVFVRDLATGTTTSPTATRTPIGTTPVYLSETGDRVAYLDHGYALVITDASGTPQRLSPDGATLYATAYDGFRISRDFTKVTFYTDKSVASGAAPVSGWFMASVSAGDAVPVVPERTTLSAWRSGFSDDLSSVSFYAFRTLTRGDLNQGFDIYTARTSAASFPDEPTTDPTPEPAAATLTLSGTTSANAGSSLTYTATLASSVSTADKTVLLERQDGASWVEVASASTNASGVASLTFTASTSGSYRASFAGDSVIAAATSSTVTLAVSTSPTLTLSSAAATAVPGFTVVLTGSLEHPVSVALRSVALQYESAPGTWATVRSVRTTSLGAVTFSERLSTTRTYRLRYIDATFGEILSPTLTVTRTQATSTLTLTTPSAAVQGATPTTFSATLGVSDIFGASPANKRVALQFLNGTSWRTLATVTTNSSGVAAFTINPTASRTYRAVFAGDTQHLTATSTTLAVAVVSYSSSLTLVSSGATAVLGGENVTLTATLTSSGSVTAKRINLQYLSGSRWITERFVATDSSGVAAFVFSPSANRTYRAAFTGDAGLTASTSPQTVTVSVTKWPSTLTLSAPSVVVGGQKGTWSAQLTTSGPQSGHRIALQQQQSNGSWRNVASASTDASGVAAIVFKPFATSGVYRAHFVEDASVLTSTSDPATTTVTKATATLGFTITGTTALTAGSSTTFSASLTDTGTPLAGRTVYIEYQLNGSWVRLTSFRTATNGTFAGSFVPHYAEVHRLRLLEDFTHLEAVSETVTLAVTRTVSTLALSATPSVYAGSSLVVTGALTSTLPVSSKTVELQYFAPATSTWLRLASARTTSIGTVSFTVRPTTSTTYRLVFAGDTRLAPATSNQATISVLTHPTSLAITAPGTAVLNTNITVSGVLTSTGSVVYKNIALQTQDGSGAWSTVATRRTSRSGAVSFSVKLTAATTYRLVFAGDSTLTTATSETRAVGLS